MDEKDIPEEVWTTALEIGKEIQEYNRKHSLKRRKKRKRVYMLVAAITVAVMGFSLSGVSEAPIITDLQDDGNSITINAYREGETPPATSTEDSAANTYKKIEKILGFDPVYFTYTPIGSLYLGGTIDSESRSAFLEYDIDGKALKYEIYMNSHPEINGDYAFTFKKSGVDITVYKDKDDYTSTWTYRDIYYCIKADINIEELKRILNGLLMYEEEKQNDK